LQACLFNFVFGPVTSHHDSVISNAGHTGACNMGKFDRLHTLYAMFSPCFRAQLFVLIANLKGNKGTIGEAMMSLGA
jgi:hypothetical protein